MNAKDPTAIPTLKPNTGYQHVYTFNLQSENVLNYFPETNRFANRRKFINSKWLI